MSTYSTPLSSGKTSPKGFLRVFGKVFTGTGVIEATALTVSAQDTPDMSVKVSGSSLNDNAVFIHTDGTFIQAWNESDISVTISANASGVTKTDAIVAYVDLTDSDASNANNPDSLKFIAVRRAGSATGAPDLGEIEATAVATNPYIVLAYVTVANGASSINSGNITDRRAFASIQQEYGWSAARETWTYGSADTATGSASGTNGTYTTSTNGISTYTFTVSGDVSGKYSPGMRVKLTQTTVKYFIITKVSYSSGTTTITIFGGTDYSLANATISDPYYSTQKAPVGFPLNPEKWTVKATCTGFDTQSSPSASTWYNIASTNFVVPLGCWDVSYDVVLRITKNSSTVAGAFVALSTSSSSSENSDLLAFNEDTGASGTTGGYWDVNKRAFVTLANKATHYLIAYTNTVGGLTAITYAGTLRWTIIRARCAYL